MRKFIVNVNGIGYEVEVEEVTGNSAAPAAPKAPAAPAAPAAQKAPTAPAAGSKPITAPMPGTILSVNVNSGDTVKSGQVLIVLEAMKMENEIMAPVDCRIASVKVQKGASVNSGDVLIEYV